MRHYIFAIILLNPLLLLAEGFISWQKPTAATYNAGGHHGGHGRKAQQFQISSFNPEKKYEVSYISSILETRDLEHKNGLVSLPKTGLGNYHALVVLAKDSSSVSSSIRYIYKHGKPSKTSPSKLTNMQKSPLEITPSPLPREHDRYKGSKTYNFKILFNSKAVSDLKLHFESENGTKETLVSNKDGSFSLTIPNDFKDVKTGRRANKPLNFTIKAKYEADGMTYYTTLSMPYSVNPNDYWRSEAMAPLLVIFGFIIGYYIIRRYVNSKRRTK